MLVETATDNPTRTVASVRNILSKHGGNLASNGSVSFQFGRMGVFRLNPAGIDQDELKLDLIDHGLDEMGESTGENGEAQLGVRCASKSLATCKAARRKKIVPLSAEQEYICTTPVILLERRRTRRSNSSTSSSKTTTCRRSTTRWCKSGRDRRSIAVSQPRQETPKRRVMKLTILTGSIAVLALLAGCAQKAPEAPAAPPPPDPVAIQAELTATMDKVLAAFANKDSASVASFFTEDATWVLPNATTFKGRANIEKGAADFLATFETVAFAARL